MQFITAYVLCAHVGLECDCYADSTLKKSKRNSQGKDVKRFSGRSSVVGGVLWQDRAYT